MSTRWTTLSTSRAFTTPGATSLATDCTTLLAPSTSEPMKRRGPLRASRLAATGAFLCTDHATMLAMSPLASLPSYGRASKDVAAEALRAAGARRRGRAATGGHHGCSPCRERRDNDDWCGARDR